MDGFEFNKIAAALLVALLVGMVASLISEGLINPRYPTKPAYEIASLEVEPSSGGDQKSKALEPVEPLLASANAANGEKVFKKCLQCHSIDKGDANKVGPNLWNVVGSKLGHIQGFAYSSALLAKGGQWTYENINHMLAKPKDFIPGTKMTFIGLDKPQDRADIIAYLRSKSDSPAPLPAK